MSEILFDSSGMNEEQLRVSNRAKMNQLFGSLSPQKLAEAMRLTRTVFSDLKPFQPVDLWKLKADLEKTGVKETITGEDLDVLISSHMLDRAKWDLVLAEWREVKGK